jgi:hypothetical protein
MDLKMMTEESLKNAEIVRQMLDYLEMPIKPVIDEKGNAIKVDQIAFWQDHSARFPDLVSLALTIVAIPASSAASERLFSISGWHCADRKDRLDKQHLAAKTFLSCNKDLLRDNLFS